MKATDAEILQAIWRAQVKKTAKGVITNYVGGNKGLTGDSEQDRHYAQTLYMISRGGLGVGLSNGQLARRLKALIAGESVQWCGPRAHAYEFRTEAAMEVFRFARSWWEQRGRPSGFDQINERMRTIRLTNYEGMAEELELELLDRFEYQRVTP